jgi:DNA-binding response OmpR family regulator
MRVLVAEDERDLNNVIVKMLLLEGYVADACYDGAEALDYAMGRDYDAVILDIMMPKLSGLEVLRHLRAEHHPVPVLLLTARDAISDRVKGLDSGANDYLVKPFAFDELMARLRAMLRVSRGTQANFFKIADLTLDCDRHIAVRGGMELNLTGKEFSLLEYLMRNQDIVLSREKIENHVWDYDFDGGTNVVDVYIRYLRRKIDEGRAPKLIHTVRGSGYVLRVK